MEVSEIFAFLASNWYWLVVGSILYGFFSSIFDRFMRWLKVPENKNKLKHWLWK